MAVAASSNGGNNTAWGVPREEVGRKILLLCAASVLPEATPAPLHARQPPNEQPEYTQTSAWDQNEEVILPQVQLNEDPRLRGRRPAWSDASEAMARTDSRAWPSGSQPPLQAGQVPPATPPYTPTTHAPTSCWEETYQPTEAKPTAATYHTAYTAPPPVHAHYDAWHDDDGPATAPVMPRAAQAAAPQAARAAPSYHQAYSTHPPPASFPPAKSTSSKFPPVQVQNIPGGRRRADWPKGFSPNEQSHVFPEASGGTVRYRNVWTEFAYKHEEEALRDSSEFYRDLQYLQLEPHEYTEGYTAYWRRHGLRAFELKRLFHLYRIEQLKLSVR